MLVNAANIESGSGVVGAIRTAARATGTSFEYLLATARAESGLKPRASAATSSARGLFQFIERTWLATFKQAGPSLGYARYADAIVSSPSGHYQVADPALRRAILALRDDAQVSAAMAGALTRDNAGRLSQRLGRSPSESELYMAHFLGASGAARLISFAAASPDLPAAKVFPAAARANRGIFYDGQGRPRQVSEVYGVLAGRFDVARASSATVAAAQPARPNQAVAAAFETVKAAAQSPQERPVFHALFSTNEPRGPVSDFVRDLWTTRPQVAAALTGAAPPGQPAQGALDLFDGRTPAVRSLFTGRS
ncbi:MAG TPA: transglycosylase SLT domain-containing protein [Xanthobacteraceae bacterium]